MAVWMKYETYYLLSGRQWCLMIRTSRHVQKGERPGGKWHCTFVWAYAYSSVAAISRPNKYCIIALYLGKAFLLQQAVSSLSSGMWVPFVLPRVHSTINCDGFYCDLLHGMWRECWSKLKAFFLSRPVLVLHVTR